MKFRIKSSTFIKYLNVNSCENKMKRALITGITGQDGSYLAELLLGKGYEVYGMHRRSSTDAYFERIAHLNGEVSLVCGDLLDQYSLDNIVKNIKPDEIYNLASQSQVKVSFDQPFLTQEINWFGVEKLMDVIEKYVPHAKFYQASTSEMFGNPSESPQNESTLFTPVSPYGEAKLRAHEAVQRERSRGLFACGGILFNHESPRRGLEFVTRKLTDGIARISRGLSQRATGKRYLEVGNLEARRDWGYAKDYVKAMWLMLQQDKPQDFVIATGKNHSVREFIESAALIAGIKINWEGEGTSEVGYNSGNEKIIRVHENFFRPREIYELVGDSSKAQAVLGWKPSVSFEELVEMMVKSDLEKLKAKTI